MKLLDVNEVARLLGVSIRTVGYRVRKGTLPKPVTAKNEKRAWNDIDIEYYMTQS